MKVTRFIAAAALATIVASPAFALDVKKSVTVDASPADTWKAIGDFCGIADWHPAVAKCDLSQQNKQMLRTLSLNGGGTIVERQLSRSDAKHSYSYAIVDSPLPVDHYRSTISVMKAGKGSKIVWSGSFKAKGADDAKAKEVIAGVYQGGLDSLQKKLAK
jgi:hypothetical protein